MTSIPLVYVIDDNPNDFLLLQEAWREIADRGEFRHFSLGPELLGHLDELPVPHLAIVDINLPLLAGGDIVSRLKGDARYRDIPVVLCSSSADHGEADRARQVGATGFFTKPSTFDEYLPFVRTMRDLIAYHASRRGP